MVCLLNINSGPCHHIKLIAPLLSSLRNLADTYFIWWRYEKTRKFNSERWHTDVNQQYDLKVNCKHYKTFDLIILLFEIGKRIWDRISDSLSRCSERVGDIFESGDCSAIKWFMKWNSSETVKGLLWILHWTTCCDSFSLSAVAVLFWRSVKSP